MGILRNFRRRILHCAPLLLYLVSARADTILTLSDGNTALDVASTGMSSWTLGAGGNIMPQQWFWFRTGSSFGSQSTLESIDSISSPTISFDSGFPSFGELDYRSSSIDADLVLNLVDGQPAVLAEQIQWTNLTSQNMYLTVFQYIHFAFSPGSDSLKISGNQATQSGVKGSSEVVADPFDSRLVGYEAANYSTILNALTNNATSASFNLNNQTSANGNTETAFEWSTVLAPNGSFTLSIAENALPAPEPRSGIFLAAGLLIFGTMLRKRCLS